VVSTLRGATVEAAPSALLVVEEGTTNEKGSGEDWPLLRRVSGAIDTFGEASAPALATAARNTYVFLLGDVFMHGTGCIATSDAACHEGKVGWKRVRVGEAGVGRPVVAALFLPHGPRSVFLLLCALNVWFVPRSPRPVVPCHGPSPPVWWRSLAPP